MHKSGDVPGGNGMHSKGQNGSRDREDVPPSRYELEKGERSYILLIIQ
jgi:hypothetical protein